MADDDDHQLHFDFFPLIRVYKNGRVERLTGTEIIPPGTDPETGVLSKDVTNIIPETQQVYARIYLPKHISADNKLPLLVYFHGGGFMIESPASPTYHNYLNTLVAQSNVIAVSVNYRKAPEHPIPIAYEDSWAVLQWVASHRDGPFLSPSLRAGDTLINPMTESGPSLVGLGCKRVLVLVAEKDLLKERGWLYTRVLSESGWKGTVEIDETEGEGHVFHLLDSNLDKAKERMKRMVEFFNRDVPPLVQLV